MDSSSIFRLPSSVYFTYISDNPHMISMLRIAVRKDWERSQSMFQRAMLSWSGAAITKVVDWLEKAGFVRREKDLQDRRFMVIHTIPEAQEKVGQLYESFANSMGSLFASYSKEESKLIFDFIMRSSTILNEETAKLNKSRP